MTKREFEKMRAVFDQLFTLNESDVICELIINVKVTEPKIREFIVELMSNYNDSDKICRKYKRER
jgi:hypothetical protein